mmetsp:Transcript_61425/g.161393  ORF Transcript_61425/g.161393 Transcript_61425/m.161393 type:complete len:233 (+) Transcript_61425:29-727(+)
MLANPPVLLHPAVLTNPAWPPCSPRRAARRAVGLASLPRRHVEHLAGLLPRAVPIAGPARLQQDLSPARAGGRAADRAGDLLDPVGEAGRKRKAILHLRVEGATIEVRRRRGAREGEAAGHARDLRAALVPGAHGSAHGAGDVSGWAARRGGRPKQRRFAAGVSRVEPRSWEEAVRIAVHDEGDKVGLLVVDVQREVHLFRVGGGQDQREAGTGSNQVIEEGLDLVDLAVDE